MKYALELYEQMERRERCEYLESRGLTVDCNLRFHTAAKYWNERKEIVRTYFAMLAPFYVRGEMCAMHVTYLSGKNKASIKPCRKVFVVKSGAMSGGAVPLSSLHGEKEMGIAEGIESALSASRLHGVPVWAALNSDCLRKFKPPKICKVLHIFGDNDVNFVGQSAAYELASRCAQILDPRVKIPIQTGWDWNDVLLRGKNK